MRRVVGGGGGGGAEVDRHKCITVKNGITFLH